MITEFKEQHNHYYWEAITRCDAAIDALLLVRAQLLRVLELPDEPCRPNVDEYGDCKE